MDAFSVMDGQTFDYIVVGGGTSGCIVASTLAARIPGCRVLLLEAGPDDSADPDNLVPGLTKAKFMNEEGNWLYKTAPQRALNGREIVYPRGRGLGGCSCVFPSSLSSPLLTTQSQQLPRLGQGTQGGLGCLGRPRR